MMICKPCKVKSGFEFAAKGCHTVIQRKCDSCGKVGPIWPSRFFKPVINEVK